ncbi:MAG: alpha/beta hydrolase [Curvibacter lanceolatus]|uniref:hypothetical protein n=1 Tax=Curvibacter lanceolatus TaxID=86182 RepID=UPI000377628F|nr:hypothetical protein [Curvibacter lanceolatus]MBV5295448.1 alpha/beta hydrolase [Curvibacter lanceolatus]
MSPTPPLFQIGQPTGYFAFQACKADRRFSYCAYVPAHYTAATAHTFRLLVVVHGSERAPEAARQLFAPLADATNCVVLAPLFPMAVTDDEELHNYLFLKYRDIRYDLLLLAMVDEMQRRFALPVQKFWLAGFSGGGQFAHRFMYLHAARLSAVSVGAPGMVNGLDPQRPWFVGVKDVQARFGQGVDRAAMHGLPVQVVVGGADTDTDIQVAPGHPLYVEGVNDTGLTRVRRAAYLHQVLLGAGAASQWDVVPDARHSAHEIHASVEAFFVHQHEQAAACHPA